MSAFFISFLFAVIQVFLLKFLMDSVRQGSKRRFFRYFTLKFLLYGVSIAYFLFDFLKYAIYCFCGFIIGYPLAVIAFYIYYTFIKKNN